MKVALTTTLSILLIAGCDNDSVKNSTSGEALAKTHCGSCHRYPAPALLDKSTWKEDVLPPMAKRMGIDHVFETVLPGQEPLVTVAEWKAILAYYISAAPDQLPDQQRPRIRTFTTRFGTKSIVWAQPQTPATSFVKIDPANHRIYAANAEDSSISIYNSELQLLQKNDVHAAIVHIDFDQQLSSPGARTGTLTNIGVMNPNDRLTGAADSFHLNEQAGMRFNKNIFANLPRPVQITKTDLDADGRNDYLVCGFGNNIGGLCWMKAVDSGFEKKSLSVLPGAISATIRDIDQDGRQDIIVLMAQAAEGIVAYLNKGHGLFSTKQLLAFPPVFGSSYFEMADFNKDGFADILYTCGDNDDYSSKLLKNYHGVYVFLNDGSNNFTQRYFFPIHGCYKAMARDFDRDGDLDIAAISFFPDRKNQPQESFVYLEQTTPFTFQPATVQDFDKGRWMTMDAGDVDGDGFDDIILGALVQPLPAQIKQWKESGQQKAALLLLHNEARHK